jgi:hypothetical protein
MRSRLPFIIEEQMTAARSNVDESNALLRGTQAARTEDKLVLRKARERVAGSLLLLRAVASPWGIHVIKCPARSTVLRSIPGLHQAGDPYPYRRPGILHGVFEVRDEGALAG